MNRNGHFWAANSSTRLTVPPACSKSPERHPVYYRGFRRMLTHRFPYKLFYRIEGSDIIVVGYPRQAGSPPAFMKTDKKKDASFHL